MHFSSACGLLSWTEDFCGEHNPGLDASPLASASAGFFQQICCISLESEFIAECNETDNVGISVLYKTWPISQMF